MSPRRILASVLDAAVGWLPAALAGLLPVVWFPWMVDSFILPRTALAETGAGLLVAAALLGGRSRPGALSWALVACAAAAGLAALFSTDRLVSLVGEYSRYESLPVRLAYCGLCWGALRLGPPVSAGPEAGRRWRERAENLFLAGCAVAAAEAMIQAALGLLLRPDGNLGQPDLLGVLLAMSVPLAVARVRRSWRWAPLTALLLVGLGLSTSRGAWLGAVVGLGLWLVLEALARSRRAALLAGVGAVGAILIAAALILLTPLRVLNQDTGSARLGVWSDGLRMIAARPLWGWGEEAVGLRFGAFQTADWEPGNQFDRLHSMPLDTLATQGVVGLAACTVLFALLWRRIARNPGAAPLVGALGAYLAWSLLDFDWVPATAPLWLLAGVGAAGTLPALRSATGRGRRTAAAVGVVVMAFAVALPPLVADAASYAGNPGLAVLVDPLQPEYHAQIGTPAALRSATRLGSMDPGVWVRLGDAARRRGDVAGARRDYQSALAIYPYDPTARARLRSLAASRPR